MPYEVIDSGLDQEQESLPGRALRTIAGTGGRIVESIAGFPGDVASTALGLTKLGVEKALGRETSIPSKVPFLPTSQDIRKIGQEAFEGYLEPQHPVEQAIGEFGAAVPFYLGGGVLPALGKAAAGQLAKHGVKYAGGSELAQAGAEILTPTALTGLIKAANPRQLKRFTSALYDTVSEGIPKSLESNIDPITEKLNKWKDWATKGSESDAGKEYVLKKIGEFESKVKDGRISTLEVNSFEKDWKKALRDKAVPEGTARKVLTDLTEGTNDVLASTASKNPEFAPIYKALREADSITYGMKSESTIRSALRKAVNTKNIGRLLVGGLLGQKILGFGPKAIGGLAGVGLAARGIWEGGEALYKSPAIRRYAGEVLKAEVKKDYPAMLRLGQKLDDLLEKEQPSSGRYVIENI